MKILSNLSGTTGNFSGTSISNITKNGQEYISKVVTADPVQAAHSFIDDTGVDSAGRYIALFEKKWTGGGAPDGNNTGIISYVLPNNALTRKATTSFRWGMFPTAGNETSTIRWSGLYSGSTVEMLGVSGTINMGLGSQVIGTGDMAIGLESRTWNGAQIAIGLRAGKTIGAATGKQNSITIGNSANAGTYPIGNYSIAIGNGAITKSGDTISIGRNAGNTTSSSVGVESITIGLNANQGTSVIGEGSVAIGVNAQSKSFRSVSLGANAGRSTGSIGIESISIGSSANLNAVNIGSAAIGLGYNTRSEGSSSIAIGDGPIASGSEGISIGRGITNNSNNTIAMGVFSNANSSTNAVAIGISSSITGTSTSAIAIGDTARVFDSIQGIAIGTFSKTKSFASIGIGSEAGNTTGTTGTQYIAIGYRAGSAGLNRPIGQYGIAIGLDSRAEANQSVSLGYLTIVSGTSGVAIGQSAQAGINAVAIGVGNKAKTAYDIAIGNSVTSRGDGSSLAIGIGSSVIATGTSVIAIGHVAIATGSFGVAIGRVSRAKGNDSISIGTLAGSTSGTVSDNNISIGRDSNFGTHNVGLYSTAVGYATHTKANYSVSLGAQAGNTTGTTGDFNINIGYAAGGGEVIKHNIGNGSISLGAYTRATQLRNIAIGYNAAATGGTNNIAIGDNTKVISNNFGIAIGSSASANGQDSIAIGRSANGTSSSGIAIGNNTITVDGIAIGGNASANYSNGVVIGNGADGGSTGGIAIGQAAKSANSSVAIGYVTNNGGSPGNETVIIGATANQSVNAGTSSVAVGYGAHSTGNRSIAIGKNARSTATNAYTIANMSATTTNNVANSLLISWDLANEDLMFVKGRTLTTGATQGTLLAFTLADGFVYSIKATIKGRKIDGTDRALYVVEALAYRQGGGAVLEGGVPYNYKVVESTGATSWNGDIDVSGNDIRVRVNGAAATTINWNVILEIQRVG